MPLMAMRANHHQARLTIRMGRSSSTFRAPRPPRSTASTARAPIRCLFGVWPQAVIAPHVPNNIGSLSAFDLVTEPYTCVDPIRPSPVTARHVIGQMLADAVFGCLAQALPARCRRKVPARSGSWD